MCGGGRDGVELGGGSYVSNRAKLVLEVVEQPTEVTQKLDRGVTCVALFRNNWRWLCGSTIRASK